VGFFLFPAAGCLSLDKTMPPSTLASVKGFCYSNSNCFGFSVSTRSRSGGTLSFIPFPRFDGQQTITGPECANAIRLIFLNYSFKILYIKQLTYKANPTRPCFTGI
jgi:hypothetical protein